MTKDDVKKQFEAEGLTVADWARGNGFEPHAVRRVLQGLYIGRWGQAHRIAVALGLKPSVVPKLSRSLTRTAGGDRSPNTTRKAA
jgi:gp16 family phage-associated protein